MVTRNGTDRSKNLTAQWQEKQAAELVVQKKMEEERKKREKEKRQRKEEHRKEEEVFGDSKNSQVPFRNVKIWREISHWVAWCA